MTPKRTEIEKDFQLKTYKKFIMKISKSVPNLKNLNNNISPSAVF